MKQKTILITGATGFLGSYITKELLNGGFCLKLLVRRATDHQAKDRFLSELPACTRKEFAHDSPSNRVEIIGGDISKSNLGLSPADYLRLAETVDEVFHCAAATKFNDDKDVLNRTNVMGTEHITCFCMIKKPKRLHYMSTAYVAGKRQGTIFENELEKDQTFNNNYEKSKYDAEKNLAAFAKQHRLPYTVYRPSIVTGDTSTGFTKNYDNIYVFGKGMTGLKNRETRNNGKNHGTTNRSGINQPTQVRIPGDKYSAINLIPVDYAVRAIIAISQQAEGINNTFHIVNPSPPTLGELAEWMKVALGINNIKIVPCHEFQVQPHTLPEKLLLQRIEVFQSYMFGEPYFDSTNTRNLLSGTGIECPLITQELVSRFIQYAIDTNWGKEKTQKKSTQRKETEVLKYSPALNSV